METSGLVDAHSHLRSTALVDHGVIGTCLEEAILRMNAMSSVDITDDVFVACSDLLSSGITGVQFIFHTFGSPERYLSSLSAAIQGIQKSGIRARVILGITDQLEFLPAAPKLAVELPDFVAVGPRFLPEQFVATFKEARSQYPNLDLGVGPVGPQWCSDAMLEALGSIAESGVRIHTHCLESAAQRHWIGQSLIFRLNRFGLLGKKTSLAHAIWLDEKELDLVANSGAQLVTCPRSNLQLKAGRADLSKWQQREIPFGVGLDSLAGKESPIEVAELSLDSGAALAALTVGGRSATDLPTDRDQVVWRDLNAGTVTELRIDSRHLIKSGALLNYEEVAEARSRISIAMSADAPLRTARQRQLDSIMPTYLQAIS